MSSKLEERVKVLEAEVAVLRTQLNGAAKTSCRESDWVDMQGIFAHDPDFDEAVRIGREWRESFRPKPALNVRKRAKGKKKA